MSNIVFETSRLKAIEAESEHIPFYASLFNEEVNNVQMGGAPLSDEVVTQIVQNMIADANKDPRRDYGVTLQDKETDEFVGYASIRFLPTDTSPDIGILLGPEVRAQGHGREVAAALTSLAFSVFPQVAQVTGSFFVDNHASKKVLLTLGFNQVAHFQQGEWNGMDYEETLVYGMPRDEWALKAV